MERLYNLGEMKAFRADQGNKVEVYGSKASGGALWCLEPGQEVPAHYHPGADDVWVVLEGEGTYFLGEGEKVRLKAGMVALAPAGAVHGMVNDGEGRFVFFAVQAPFPVETVWVE